MPAEKEGLARLSEPMPMRKTARRMNPARRIFGFHLGKIRGGCVQFVVLTMMTFDGNIIMLRHPAVA